MKLITLSSVLIISLVLSSTLSAQSSITSDADVDALILQLSNSDTEKLSDKTQPVDKNQESASVLEIENQLQQDIQKQPEPESQGTSEAESQGEFEEAIVEHLEDPIY